MASISRHDCSGAREQVDLWVREQQFEEDVRAVVNMMRPHGRERLMGWLIGSSRESGDLPPAEEFAHYRQVVRELYKRIDEMEACYT